MTWKYEQATGTISQDGTFEGTGYSGTGEGRNNPEMQDAQGVGPIPCGSYTIGPAHDNGSLGPVVMNLDPQPGTDTMGRSLFRIHGDNANHDASHGCIVLGPSIRRLIAASGDTTLTVTP